MASRRVSVSMFDKGFRPFFLLASVFSAGVVPLWLAVFTGAWSPRGPLVGVIWHGHEMIFGFTAAVLAGFLLTAVANWTGRETAVGAPLAVLVAVWAAGRVALLGWPGWPASAIDLAFLPLLAATIGVPIAHAGNTRNAVFPLLLLVLAGANGFVHLDALGFWPGAALAANRLAVHAVCVIILVVAGRIIPAFTRNATGRTDLANQPLLDATAVLATAAVGVLPLVGSPDGLRAAVAAVGAVAVAGRTWRWGAGATAGEPLLWVLHVGHGWVAVGLALEAVGPSLGWAPSVGLHALTVGAMGTLTLGMMARVALGHTGRPLRATPVVGLAFAAVGLAALARIVGPTIDPTHTLAWLTFAGVAWLAAFGTYAVAFVKVLVSPRL